ELFQAINNFSKRMKRVSLTCLLTVVVLCYCLRAAAQSYSLDWLTVAGAGGTSTGGTYSASVTVGQPVVGAPVSGGPFSLSSGFWSPPTVIRSGLSVSPQSGLVSSGPLGGPFFLGDQTYRLSNSTSASINWTASKTAGWLNLNPSSGTLAPG